jgi:hypothetical protein
MANFSKIFGLAGVAVVFAGVAYGQGTCTAGTPATNIIRAEGTTELIAPVVFTCTAGGVAGTLNLQMFLSPALPITSKILDSATGKTEAVASIGGVQLAYGIVSGSTLSFSGIAVGVGPFTVTVNNVRVNATSLTVGSGVPPNISATLFVSGSAGSVTPAALSYTNVAFAQNGLAPAKTYKSFTSSVAPTTVIVGSSTGANNFVVCRTYSPHLDGYTGTQASVSGGSLAFVVQVNENFASAFKKQADEASTVTVPAAMVTPSSVTNFPVNSGTRIKLTFANVPAAVTLYVPSGVVPSTTTSGSAATIELTASETGALTPVTASTLTSISPALLAPVTVTSGTGTAVFEVLADDPNNFDQFNIPVFAVTTANSVAGSSTAITTTVSFAPIGSTNIPNFASTSSSTTLTGSTFNLCTTSLLFPFVTNELGFDTGLAIANTSTDPFGTVGATAQAGTCTLNFYGAGAPSPSNVTTPNVPSGTVYTSVLSSVAAGFQGYIIAQCQFQYAHGFAFVTDGVGATGGLSQGYLAGVIPDVNQLARGANPIGVAVAGEGETLGN